MSKMLKVGFVVLLFTANHINTFAIGIRDAIEQKIISLEMKGVSGKTIEISLYNLSGKIQTIVLEAGQFLMPDDPGIQRMMLSKDTNILLSTTKTAILNVKTFCTQNYKSGLHSTTRFSLGKMAEGHLLKLAKLISKNNYYSDAAQQAVWCLTDNADLYGIVGGTPAETKCLREFVHNATGQSLTLKLALPERNYSEPEPPQSRPSLSTKEHVLKDTIRFSNRERCTTSLTISDSTGKEIVVMFKDRPLGANANATYTFSFTYRYMETGTYFIRLKKNSGELIYEKEMLVIED